MCVCVCVYIYQRTGFHGIDIKLCQMLLRNRELCRKCCRLCWSRFFSVLLLHSNSRIVTFYFFIQPRLLVAENKHKRHKNNHRLVSIWTMFLSLYNSVDCWLANIFDFKWSAEAILSSEVNHARQTHTHTHIHTHTHTHIYIYVCIYIYIYIYIQYTYLHI